VLVNSVEAVRDSRRSAGVPGSCSKKIITFRISGPDKYQQVVLVVCWGVYSSIVGML
jgi:hypothetical protein